MIKLETFVKICNAISSTDEDLNSICNREGLTYHQLGLDAARDKEREIRFTSAITDRALKYFEKCRKIVEDVQEFYETKVVNRAGEHKIKRERSNAVATAKLKVDYYMWACEMLAPHIFGSHAREIKEVQRKIEELQTLLTNVPRGTPRDKQ